MNAALGILLIIILFAVAGEVDQTRKEMNAMTREFNAIWLEIYDLKRGKKDGEGDEDGGRQLDIKAAGETDHKRVSLRK